MFTVANLYDLPLLSSANVLTGSSGFHRAVESTGVMDHECNSSIISEEFYPGDLILSSFLILKDSPEKIPQVIMDLIDANISCIGISDLYLLEVPEDAIKYAVEKDTSIFLFSKDIPFEEIIITVFDCIHSSDSEILFSGHYINDLLKYCEDSAEIKNIVRSMNILLRDEITVIYAVSKNGFSIAEYNMTVNAINLHPFFANTSTVLYKRNELAIILSSDHDENNSHLNPLLRDFLSLSDKRSDIHIGISGKGNDSADLGLLMQQASDTCSHAILAEKKYMTFSDMGMFAILYPMSRSKLGNFYIKDNLYPLIYGPESGKKKNSMLFETLEYYIKNDKNIKKTAQDMYQHENTVRYRIKQITEALNIDPYSDSDWLRIELAVYLHFIKQNNPNV